MPEILLGIAVAVAIFVFALIGLINVIVWLFGSRKQGVVQPSVRQPTLTGDVLASRRLIDHLRATKVIGEDDYARLRGFLDQQFPDQFEAPTRVPSVQDDDSSEQEASTPAEKTSSAVLPPELVPLSKPDQPTEEVVIVAEAVKDDAIASPGSTRIGAAFQPVASSQSPSSQPALAPWDRPDPPPRPPRRSFADLMSGFMQEKNMRWGELTSGVLIVLSAVGLVVSLRKELDAIPYFSALLFMLITAAIHGSGIYTLKKWKLRNTSRGTLVIGLLLIPLNFVAACILSSGEDERRALNDPWLWAAVIVGVSAFSAMTWWSSKCLLRRGQLAMTIAVMGSGIGALLLNRWVETAGTSLHYLVYALPILASFIVGTCWFDPRQWVRQRWTERGCNRLFLFLGLSAFSAIAALSLVAFGAESKWVGWVAITPIISVICIVGSSLGSLVSGHAVGKSKKSLRFIGFTLEILGLILMGISLFVSIRNPTVLAINSLVSGVALIAMFIYQRNERRLPVAWGVLAVGALAGLNLAIGKFGFDQWASPGQLQAAILNGKSGLCLLAVGAVVVGFHLATQNRIAGSARRRSFVIQGWISGGAIFLAGCLIALVASLLNRENVFDQMTASGLLLVAAAGLLAVSLIFKHKNVPALENLPNATCLLLIGGLAHALIWNPPIAGRFNELTGNIGAGWWAVLAVHSLTSAVAAALMIQSSSTPSSRTAGNLFAYWSILTTAILSVGMFTLVPFQSGWATVFAIIASVSWFSIGSSWHRGGAFREGEAMAEVFVLSTGLLVSVAIAELLSRFSWCPTFELPKHWLIQLFGIAAWAIIWSVFTVVIEKTNQLKWLHFRQIRLDQVIMFGAAVVFAMLIGDQLFWGSARELTAMGNMESAISFASTTFWMYAALVALGFAFLVSLVELPTAIKGAGFVGIWMLCWAYGADSFDDSKSVASAIRWLLPIGGAIGGIVVASRRPAIPAWMALRNRLNLPEPSRWTRASTQQLINFALTIVAGVMIFISTVTIAQVFLNGVESLGGPEAGSWFGRMRAEISYGIPIAIVVGTFLLYAISERRQWLATVGSVVFQYIVVLAIVLLFLSPDPAFATKRFINILQSVAIGMTGYGFVWYWMRDRIEADEMRDRIEGDAAQQEIEGQGSQFSDAVADHSAPRTRWLGIQRISQIQVHTLINGLLVTSLAVLAMGRFYFVPDQPGAWISSVGSLTGVIAWAAFGVLAFFVWHENLAKQISVQGWIWLVGWMGLVLVGLAAAAIDRIYQAPEDFVAWLPFRIVMSGAILVSLIQTGLMGYLGSKRRNSTSDPPETNLFHEPSPFRTSGLTLACPVLVSCALALVFAIRGAWSDPDSFWLYLGTIGFLVVISTAVGWMLTQSALGFVSCAIASIGATLFLWEDPLGWFTETQPYWSNLNTVLLGLIAIAWTAFYVYRRRVGHQLIRRSFVLMPNLVLLGGAIWIFLASLFQVLSDSGSWLGGNSPLVNPLGISAMLVVIALWIGFTWNDRGRFRVVSGCLISLAIVMVLISAVVQTEEGRFVGVNLGAALMVSVWGLAWLNRGKYFRSVKRLGATRLVALERTIGRQLPICSLIVGVLVLWAAFVASFFVEARPHRYAAALVPLALAVGLGAQSDQTRRRWLQVLSLCLVMVGALFLAWADLDVNQMTKLPMLSVLVRSLIVLAGAMFVYGALVTRWVRPGDTWLKSLREMTVVTCGLAIACLVLVVLGEFSEFNEEIGCGLLLSESIAVAVLVLGMMVGLVTIAVRPRNDPFALSVRGRMGYVYAAEFVGLGLAAHLYLSMPWLFQLGIKDYWPYILMALCFGGVGIAQLLEKRNLTVLGQPLFNSAAVLPLLIAVAIFAVDSKAEFDVVMLIAGMVYLVISFTHHSMLSGGAAILFGNLALWIFFRRYPDWFSFLDHPQLWLIPPAISVLVAGHLSRNLLTKAQLSTLRYICVAVIYVSSTMEIFITGVGDQLWPPIVLAILAVVGIMSGIMFRVKAFLYFGSLFLLMAMITMVAHAHQRLDHVWPWWAFGIGLGLAILVMFGLFEKKKNEMNAMAGRLREWDA